jgi:hypothetical protein
VPPILVSNLGTRQHFSCRANADYCGRAGSRLRGFFWPNLQRGKFFEAL